MRVLIWVWKYVPFAAFVWFRIIARLWGWGISNLEAVLWWGRAREARGIVPLLRESLGTVYALAEWYARKRFMWRSVPWCGLWDHAAKPWITVERNYGDCDDMARLAAWILKGKYPEMRKVAVYSRDGRGQMFLVVKHLEDKWLRLSNMYVAEFTSFEDAVRLYKDDTAFWYAW